MANEDIKLALDALGVKYAKNTSKKKLEALHEAQSHVLTAEDLEENPELKETGAEVGDKIYIPAEGTEAPESEEEGSDEPEAEDDTPVDPDAPEMIVEGSEEPEADEEPEEEEEPPSLEGLHVASRLKHNGFVFEAGDEWPHSESQPEVTASLLAGGTLK